MCWYFLNWEIAQAKVPDDVVYKRLIHAEGAAEVYKNFNPTDVNTWPTPDSGIFTTYTAEWDKAAAGMADEKTPPDLMAEFKDIKEKIDTDIQKMKEAVGARGGGLRRKATKRKATKRKATKRKATRRKSTKRKVNRRKSTKRKVNRRKSTKRKNTRRRRRRR